MNAKERIKEFNDGYKAGKLAMENKVREVIEECVDNMGSIDKNTLLKELNL